MQPAFQMDQFILFGDSITQQCFSPGCGTAFGAALSNTFARRLDVVNRGLSGYNTTQALKMLPYVMPQPDQARVRFMTIFFGANDARIAGSPGGPDQSVHPDKFKENLKSIVQHPCVQAHKEIRLILITPPPIDECQCLQADQEKYQGLGAVLRRRALNTARYASCVINVGNELGVPVLDIWSSMMARANGYPPSRLQTAGAHIDTAGSENSPLPGSMEWPANETLREFLFDGLHLTGKGYQLLYEKLMELIERTWPDQMPDSLPLALPAWDDSSAWI